MNESFLVPKDSVETVDGLETENPEQVDALVESKNEDDVYQENLEYGLLVNHVKDKFEAAKLGRQNDEERWLSCYRNYRGLYGPDVQFTDTEKSRAFVKITKTKVLAAYSKITEVLFSGNKFPIGIEPTPVPEGIAANVHFDVEEESAPSPEKPKRPHTITREDIWEKLGPLQEKLSELPESVEIKEGVGKKKSSQTFEPALIAARNMDKKIQDQLDEANAHKALRSVVFEQTLFGTGILKGPLVSTKEYPRWDEKGQYNPKVQTIADMEAVSIWDCYPDPEARTKDDCEYWIQRHRLSKSKLRKLKNRPFFRPHSVDLAIEAGPNYQNEMWEDILNDDSNIMNENSRYEALEFWGIIETDFFENTPFENDLPDKYKEMDQISVNIWICNGQLLRVVLNPFTPVRIPYHAVPYEVNPYSVFGIGVAENMFDTQLIMNGFFRLAIDNAVLSSNLIFEVDETNLAPGQNMSVYPGKVFRRQGGAPGQAIFAQKYPNVTQECILMFDKARQLSDEATGMPSYAHGISGIMSTGRTASGMSMLMNAADENIKSVIRNVDDYLLVPLGKDLYAFNMQFDFDQKTQGDLQVIALGTESLMRNEIRSQKILQFLQMTTNEADIPFVKRDYLLRELAHSLDLDPDKTVNDPREAAIQAMTMREMRETMGTMESPLQQSSNIQGLSSGQQVQQGGAVPTPGNQEFSGSIPPNLGQGGGQT